MQIEPSTASAVLKNDLAAQVLSEYPFLWEGVILDWSNERNEDAAWLTYSANYLLRTGNVHWGLDPYFMPHRFGIPHNRDLVEDFSKCQFVVFSHTHNDHLDLSLIYALRDLPIQWIIPEFMMSLVMEKTSLAKEKILPARPGGTINLGNLVLTPFNGLHIRESHGVPELGYLAEFNGKRWLFPGDIRDYDLSKLPDFGPLDGTFAHLWLGKGCALEENPPRLDDFHAFFSHLDSKQIVVTHLQEIGRVPEELWDLRHYDQAFEKFQHTNGQTKVYHKLTGQKVIL